LRGIAVLAVMLFHADLGLFGGGYVGVDVFFVISGFLITGIIWEEIGRGTFTVAGFYERRIRRIFPALFAVLFACLLVGAWVLLPDEFRSLGESVAATTLFLSNLYFALKSSYFDGPAELSPLVHTWSLAVEEQFYIVYPIALALLARFARRWVPVVILAGALVSLAVSIWAVAQHPTAAFYLAPSRGWELLLGALLALGVVPELRDARLRNLAAVAGAVLMMWNVVAYSKATPFPGVAAIAPCLGAALVIHAGTAGPTILGRLLSLRPVVFVCLISYSLYLWHWPALVLVKEMRAETVLPPLLTAATLGTAFVLSVLSWSYVEQPFRDRRRFARRSMFLGGGAAMAGALGLGLLVVVGDGVPGRFSTDVLALAAAGKDIDETAEVCLNMTVEDAARGRFCSLGADVAPPSFILLGDSHAAALMSALAAAAGDAGRAGFFAGNSACPPLVGVDRAGEGDRCSAFNDAVLDRIVADASLSTVILAARWALSAEGLRYKQEPGDTVLLNDVDSRTSSLAENRAVFGRGLIRTLTALREAGKRIIVVGPVPEIGYDVPKALAVQQRNGAGRDIAPTLEEFMQRQAFVLPSLSRAAEAFGATLVLPHQVLCDVQHCAIERDGRILYFDDHHLSLAGARLLVPLFAPIMSMTAPTTITHRWRL
jgi:peptidoglycan/LPS O-acetylase OafA/YrhL